MVELDEITKQNVSSSSAESIRANVERDPKHVKIEPKTKNDSLYDKEERSFRFLVKAISTCFITFDQVRLAEQAKIELANVGKVKAKAAVEVESVAALERPIVGGTNAVAARRAVIGWNNKGQVQLCSVAGFASK